MKIAILGWGSLIWDPKDLKLTGKWQKGGPTLKIEFSRISKNGRLTLVIDETNGVDVTTLYNFSSHIETEQAIEDLRKREGTAAVNIGYIDFAKDTQSSVAQKIHPNAVEAIRSWASKAKVDGVIWTALEPNFGASGEPFSTMAAARHFAKLQAPAKDLAVEYLANAPSEVDTPVRRLLSMYTASPLLSD